MYQQTMPRLRPRHMARALVIVTLCGIAPAATAVAYAQDKSQPAPNTAPSGTAASKIERGRYLVSMMGCIDCHTPKTFGPAGPGLDASRLLAGHPEGTTPKPIASGALDPMGWAAACNGHMTAWVGPWGTSFAINLTPDRDTGIGSWTEGMFVKALRTGKHMGEGRPILPPMPAATYAHATDDDLSAMFAYLRTVPPIRNVVPDPLPPAGAGGGASPGH